MKKERSARSFLFCKQPDRDEPRIRCGYPLPCPHHTLTIDPVASTVTIPLSPDTRLGQLADFMRRGSFAQKAVDAVVAKHSKRGGRK